MCASVVPKFVMVMYLHSVFIMERDNSYFVLVLLMI